MENINTSKPSLEQWSELFKLAAEIKSLKPWTSLWDTDLITLILPDLDEPVFCSIMGKNDQCYAIGAYQGFDSLVGFRLILQSSENDPAFITGFEQKCLMLYYGNREHVDPKDREVYNSLGLKFRGRNEWVHFRAMEPGYYPWYFDSDQADLMIQVLKNLKPALEYYYSNDVKIDFDEGKTLLRRFSNEESLWHNEVSELPYVPVSRYMIVVENDILIARINRLQRNYRQLEYDMFYFPLPIKKDLDVRPQMSMMLLLADRKAGLIINKKILENDDAVDDAALKMLIDYMATYGKPASINIRDERMACIIADLCEKTKIKLISGNNMDVINTFIKML